MDGHTPLDATLDQIEHWRMVDAIAAATTHEEVAEIQATCQHKYPLGSQECKDCGYVKPADPDFLIDDIPF